MQQQTFQPVSELSGDVDGFVNRLIEMYNQSAVVVMISLGHQLGLFDVLDKHESMNIDALSEQTDLNQRYLREWLSVLVTGKVIEYDLATLSFRLPQHHAACLTRESSPGNMAVTSQFISLIAQSEPKLIDCFYSGKGLGYHEYHDFHRVMAEDSYQTVVSALFSHILPLVEGLSQRLERGSKVLDIGCGAGLALLKLAQAYPESEFVGYDLCTEAFHSTARLAKEKRLTNLSFEALDATNLNENESYDVVLSFDAIHDQASPAKVLSNIYQALKPGGVYLMQDIAGSSYLENNIDHPLGPLLYAISTSHCTPVSIGQGGPGLGTLWGEELAQYMLQKAGFQVINKKHLEHDPFNTYFICQKKAKEYSL